jgi:hypothetical protein
MSSSITCSPLLVPVMDHPSTVGAALERVMVLHFPTMF